MLAIGPARVEDRELGRPRVRRPRPGWTARQAGQVAHPALRAVRVSSSSVVKVYLEAILPIKVLKARREYRTAIGPDALNASRPAAC